MGGGPHENKHRRTVSGQELTTRPEAQGELGGVFFFPSAKPRAGAQFEGQSEESRKEMILFGKGQGPMASNGRGTVSGMD